MKKMNTAIRCTGIVIVVFLLSLSLPAFSQGAMNDFCVTPPFIVGGVTPNLLLMIDNSASMFDLTYVDAGTNLRRANYCYDQTYQFGFHYAGYFKDWFIYYEYDFVNEHFVEIPAFPVACDKFVAGSLCIDLGVDAFGDTIVTRFVAEGNYLNWLSASKFDIQKAILTGGKYSVVNQEMIQETRGCVGRKFIKEALDQPSFIEGGVNTPLGITFGIRGPKHPYSETSLSFGGTTEIDIFEGDYDEQLCGDAINSILDDENKQTIQNNIEACLVYTSGKYCSLNDAISCNNDADCTGIPGFCNIVNDGVCGILNDGVCTVSTPGACTLQNNGICGIGIAGVCTADDGVCGARVCVGGVDDGNACNNNGQCDSGVCSRLCVGGGVAGSPCNNDNDCQFSDCTAGNVGNLCSADADCDVMQCTDPVGGSTIGMVCVVDADCNTKECTAGSVGDECAVDTECDTKKCTAPDPGPRLGLDCNVNTDCNSAAGICTAPPIKVGNPCIVNTDCNSAPGNCTAGLVGNVCLVSADCDKGFGFCQQPVTQQIKSTFTQSVHECYQYWQTGGFVGVDYLNIIANPAGCNQIYKEYKICNGGARDGEECTADVDCSGGGTCVNGPSHIRPGSAALICSSAYTGYCAASPDNWNTTNWVPREYADADACITAKFAEFCIGAQQPPVVDPTDDPSTTEEFDNLPAIIADLGLENQLGQPIGTLIVKIEVAVQPTGLIQDFDTLIHFGAMTFNYFGSTTECPGDIPCTKVCQAAGTVCVSNVECPAGDPCVLAANLDGGQITGNGYIQGNCSTTVATTCNRDTHCPAGEICVYDVGDHTTGLIHDIDDIFASTWTPFAEGFYNAMGYFAQRVDVRLNVTDFITEAEDPNYRDPVQYRCQKNNVLLISDGMSTADLHPDPSLVAATYNGVGDNDGEFDLAAAGPGACPKFAGSRNLDDIAWVAKNRNIEDFTQAPDPDAQNSQTLTTHVVFNGVATADPGECNPDELMSDTGANGGGTYARAENPEELYNALRQAFLMIAGRAASGTAASVLASGEGTGANLVQAIFYPERTFAGTEILWSGSLKNLWYHIDPLLGNSSIREDTVRDDALILNQDNIVHFFFDDSANLTKARLFEDLDGDGAADDPANPVDIVFFENVSSLWEAGAKLWRTNPAARTIYTTTDGSSLTSFEAPVGAGSPLIPLLQVDNEAVADKLIDYIRGVDYKACSVTTAQTCATNFDCPVGETCEQAHFCSQSVGTSCVIDADCPGGETCMTTRNRTFTVDVGLGPETHVWKLGDIINATPRIISWVPLNAYDKTYNDMTYEDFTELPTYTGRGVVLVGANDGMLHAFNLGVLELFEERYKKAAISGAPGSFGLEQWAYIPKGALAYLKHMADPAYCHVYSVDLTPYIFDASIGNGGANYWDDIKDETTWRTVVIGGMRFGGAANDACTSDITDDALIDSDDCVITPAAGIGFSTYFALDITDLNNPQLLWEFSNENIPGAELATGGLGYTTAAPALVRVSALTAGIPDKTKNGRWFVVLGSGPTGPIDTDTHQFKGYSDQPLKLFILDLATGQLLNTINSGIPYAFAGSMVDASIDYDQNDPSSESNYQDDALYFGFVKAENNPPVAATDWNVGGVLRLTTKNDLNSNNWVLSTFMDNTGPVTSQVAKLQDFRNYKAFLFWGTGRYYYKIADVIDDAITQRAIYGVNEPCFGIGGFDDTCVDTVNFGDLGDASAGASADADGWYIVLDQCTDIAGNQYANCADPAVLYMTERAVTDPLAAPIGAVFFTTTKPAADVCEFGGTSHLWAVDWDTGGAVASSVLRGKAVMQVSTASIEEIDLKTAFTEKSDAADALGRGRRTSAFQGVPPAGSPPGILVPPDPINKFIHIYEK
jgi:type IV pilus assembly protein PilY1